MNTELQEAESAEVAATEKRVAAVEANMVAAGIPISERVQEDYFAFDLTFTYTMPDGVSKIIHKALTEGDRKSYLNKVNRDITIKKASGDAQMRMASGDEKYALLERAIVGWDMLRKGQLVVFSRDMLTKFLDSANPVIIDGIHKEVVKKNPWLLAEMSVEDIEKEISELTELLETKKKEEAGKAAS